MSDIITRKIEIFVDESNSDKKLEYYQRLRNWSYNARTYANDIMSLHMSTFFLDNLNKQINGDDAQGLTNYLETLNTKTKELNPCSKQNLAYKLLSTKYKDSLPSTFRTSINAKVYQDFSKNLREVLVGNSSVISYKKNFPLFFQKNAMREFSETDNGVTFTFNSIPIKFKFGRDKSNNYEIVKRILSGEYTMGDSSIVFDNKKMFLLLVIKMPKQISPSNKDKVLGVDLGIIYPAYIAINDDNHFRLSIGDSDSFLKQRLVFQKNRRSLQESLKLTNGGRGRKHKLRKLEDISEKERNFVKTMNHTISKIVVDNAVKNGCGTINLEDLKGIGSDEKNKFILRNWSYYELQQFITYKAKQKGIEVNLIDPKYSSQRCSKCGEIHSDNRQSQSKFVCVSCGFETNADYNGAKNISLAHTPEYKKQIEKHIKKLEDILV